MKQFFALFSLIFLGFTGVSKAQLTEAKFKEVFGKADGAVYDGNYSAALPLLEELYDSDSTNSHVCYLLGVTYLNTFGKRPLAVAMLEKAIGNVKLDHRDGDAKDKTAPGLAYYYLAKAYHLNYKFEDAITNYFNYRSFISMDDYTQYAEVKRQIESAENGKTLVDAPVKVRIQNLGMGINSKWDDFSPVVAADGSTLIFTSRRQGNTGGKLTREGKYFDDIYITKNVDGRWSAPKSIGSNINTDGHEATIGLSADGQQLLVYKDDNGDGNIYYSKLNGESWSALTKYGPSINAKSWETHASISADGNLLYFTSNRAGGVGGRDIYYCKKLPNNDWSLPKNLGKVINTPYDEEAPFISADGNTLYFASRGHISMGGFDIMYSTKVDTGWSEPQNIGYPINTPDDDVFFVTTADGNTAYYSSQKPDGIGGLDIYLINFEEKEKKNEPSIAVLKGTVKTKDTRKAPANTNIVVTNKSTNEVVGIFKPNTSTGAYLISLNTNEEYLVSYELDGYTQKREEIDLKTDPSYREIEKDILLEPVGGTPVASKVEKTEPVQEVVKVAEEKPKAESTEVIASAPKEETVAKEETAKPVETSQTSESQALIERKRQLEEQIKQLRTGKEVSSPVNTEKEETKPDSSEETEEDKKKQQAAELEAQRLAKAEAEAMANAEAAKKNAAEEKIVAEKQAKLKAEEDAKAKAKMEAEARAKAKAAAIDKAKQEAIAKQKAEQEAKVEADKVAQAQIASPEVQTETKAATKEEEVASAMDKLMQKKEDEANANSEYERLKAQADEAQAIADKKAKEAALAQKAAKSASQDVANAKVAAELKAKKEAEAKASAAAKSKLLAAQKAKEAAELKAIETKKAQLEAENTLKRAKLGLKEGDDIQLALAKLEEEMKAKQSQEMASLESLKEKEEAFKKAKLEAEEIQKQKAKATAEKKALEDLRIKEEQRLKLEAEAQQREEQQKALAAKQKEEQEARAAQIAEERRIAQAKAEEERMKAAQAREEAKKAAREKFVADSIAKVQTQLALKAKQKADQEKKEKEQYELKVQYESGEMQKTISTQKKRISDLENDNRLLREEMKAMADQVAFLTKELEYQKSRFQEAQQRNDQIRSLILNEQPATQITEPEISNDDDFSKLRENKKVILKNIYFDYDKSFLKRESFPELNKLYNYLVMHSDLNIEIGGHTDSKGNDEYNLNLSRDRATAVMEHLTAKGINGKRLRAVGYGETQPIAPNANPNGTDSPEGRQQNRRIEIRIFK
jgi:outer membrane protein OmpA-like peptidoglycan-associated protein